MGLFDIFSNSDAEKAAADKTAGLNAGYGQASKLLGQGRDAITSNYDQAYQPFQTLFNQSQPGAQAYGDATGANGAAGYAKALDSFHTSPGFDASLTYGLQGIDRGAAARGNVSSGNTLMAEQKFGNDLGNQEFGNYVSRLQPYLTAEQAAATGGAAVKTGEGTALNSSFGNQGQLVYQTQTGIGNANAAADLNNYNVSNNMWGALMNGAKLATGVAGGL